MPVFPSLQLENYKGNHNIALLHCAKLNLKYYMKVIFLSFRSEQDFWYRKLYTDRKTQILKVHTYNI